MCQIEELETHYRNSSDIVGDICSDHESLIKTILEEEEEIVQMHRSHVDSVVDVVKKDMQLLEQVDQPNSNIESYIEKLDALLIDKVAMIAQMREKLIKFHRNVKREEALQSLYKIAAPEASEANEQTLAYGENQMECQEDITSQAATPQHNYSQQQEDQYSLAAKQQFSANPH